VVFEKSMSGREGNGKCFDQVKGIIHHRTTSFYHTDKTSTSCFKHTALTLWIWLGSDFRRST